MSHSNLPTIYTEKTFGDLVTLPSVHEQNASLLTRAKAACEPVVASLPTDLTKLAPEALEALDAQLNGLQIKLSDGAKLSEERRKPFTQYMDKIKGEFTGIEKGFTTLHATFKTTRDAIATERIRRQKAEAKRQEGEIAKKQEEVMYKTHLFQSFNAAFLYLLNTTVTKMIDTFNGKAATELADYTATLAKWTPVYKSHKDICKNGTYTLTYLTPDEAAAINEVVINELALQFKTKYETDLTAERDRLIELKDSRVRELNDNDKAAIEAREKKEADDRKELLDKQLAQQKQQAEVQQETDLLNASFDVAASGSEPIALTKNTTTKKKYVVATHAAWAAIIQSWVTAEMPTMTVADLEKKLAFMLTSANKRLNDGVTLEAKGLSTVDDVSTRTSKK